MRLLWECHDQSQETNWRHCVTGPELPFFRKRKGVLKIDQSVKMPWHRLSVGVACSYSLAPGPTQCRGAGVGITKQHTVFWFVLERVAPFCARNLFKSKYIFFNASTAVGALMTLLDFTLSNARRFYSSMRNPLAVKGLIQQEPLSGNAFCT